jgi:uracil-DNA glycosylase
MDQVARVQLVKCIPDSDVVPRGEPTKEMCRRCPRLFMFEELQVLAPGALVVFGQDAFDAISEHGGISWRRNRGYFCRGTFELDDGRAAELFWLPHPSGSNWTKAYPTLSRSLRARRAV